MLRELLQLMPSWEGVRADVSRFLEAAQQASQASVSMIAGALQLLALPCPHCSEQKLPLRCVRTNKRMRDYFKRSKSVTQWHPNTDRGATRS